MVYKVGVDYHSSSPSRYITTLLEDVVFFVIKKENHSSGQHDALNEEGSQDRDRQKLLREQNVLKEVRREWSHGVKGHLEGGGRLRHSY